MLSFQDTKKAVDLVIKSGHVPNIVGLQGIGKTDLVKEYAQENGYAFEEITCSLLQEGDLAMPYLDGSKNLQYSVNSLIEGLVSNSNGRMGILFLDEINRASEKVQSELMNLVLQRRIVGYVLPDNICVVCAMNPNSSMKGYENTDYSVSFSDAAILGRIVTLDMQPNLGEWLQYGLRTREDGESIIHKSVREFLTQNPALFTTKESEGKLNNTPRGWQRASDVVYQYSKLGYTNDTLLLNILQGTLEETSASRFLRFFKTNRKTIDYYKVARETLGIEDEAHWNPVLFDMNDAELSRVFRAMCEITSCSEEELATICRFVMIASSDLAFSLVTALDNQYKRVYNELIEQDQFADFVIDILAEIKNTEVGEFHGK